MGIVSDLLRDGLGWPMLPLTADRVAMGAFFAISGYHKLFNPSRRATLIATLRGDGVPALGLCCWAVPLTEFAGGCALVVGLLSAPAALALIVVCACATCFDGVKRIPTWKPLDRADALDDFLYLPEVLYVVALSFVLFQGPGPLSLDAAIAGALP